MARFRLSRPAQTDFARILSASLEQWGAEGKRRYAVTLATAMRKLASDPQGTGTRDRGELQPGLRSLHLRYAGVRRRDAQVRRPVHVLYYRVIRAGLVEIARILHERMEPARWLETGSGPEE
jgi:toxin ParE1/3/4